MNYQIKIIKTEPNPKFAEQLAQYQEGRGRYSQMDRGDNYPSDSIVKDVLICELTEEQYKKVKAEVIKVFE